MGWKDAPLVDEEVVKNKWESAPIEDDAAPPEASPVPIQEQPDQMPVVQREWQRLQSAAGENNQKWGEPLRTLANVGEIFQSAGNVVGELPSNTIKMIVPQNIRDLPARGLQSYIQNPKNATAIENAKFLIDKYKNLSEMAKESFGTVAKIGGGVLALSGLKPVLEPVTTEAKVALSSLGKIPESKVEQAISKGINKGVKPTVVGKKTLARYEGFSDKASEAVKTIAENKDAIKVLDVNGEVVPHPRNAGEMAQAVDQAKKIIYKKYNDMALAAGDAGAKFDVKPVMNKLDAISKDLKYSKEVRSYADGLKSEIDELHGQPPEIIEARIADLNNSLSGFYDGRVSKAKAQIDASVANLMREELDNKISNAVGEGYQGLKNQYGALKAIEKEVNHRAIVNARKQGKGLIDMTDIFTGADLAAGVLTMNPLLIAKGAAGKGLMEIYKNINNPDRYIDKMFKTVYKYEDQNLPKTGEVLQGKRSLGGLLGNERGSIGVNPQVKSDNFKKWFGDWEKAPEQASKVVDESGEPLVVYHGTRQDFNEFSKSKSGDNYKFVKKGQFFTDNPEEASFYTELKDYDNNIRKGEYPNIKPVFLTMKNPIVREIKGNATNYLDRNLNIFFKNAKAGKNDGIIVKGDDGTGNVYVTINPNQIKSATGNSGAFSKATNDIRGNTGLKMLAGTAAAGVGGTTLAGMVQNRKKGK